MDTKLHNEFSPHKKNQPPDAKPFAKNPIAKIKKEFTTEEKYRIVLDGQGGQLSIGEICLRDGISPATFYQWSVEFLEAQNHVEHSTNVATKFRNDSDRFKVVIEGKSGETSVQEILKREHISHEIFLQWCRDFSRYRQKLSQTDVVRKTIYEGYKKKICQISGLEAFSFIENYIDFCIENQIVTTDVNQTEFKRKIQTDSIICLKKLNDIRDINSFFEKANDSLYSDGMLIGCFETYTSRMNRLNYYKIPIYSKLCFGVDFLFKRLIPKLSFTKRLFFNITKGNDQLLSKAECLGRLVCYGFKIIDFKDIGGLIYFVVKREKEPTFYNKSNYGIIYTAPRIGKGGKMINIYKFRTMHPYSEYLQDYVLRVSGYSESGKPAEDFRIPAWGKFMRRYWLDEIPQLINLFKGDLKLVGIRPVSQRYFQDIPKEMQKLRLTQKPGCIPPVIALNRSGNVMSVLQSEKEYLEEKIKRPKITDAKYFFKAIFNILFNHKRGA